MVRAVLGIRSLITVGSNDLCSAQIMGRKFKILSVLTTADTIISCVYLGSSNDDGDRCYHRRRKRPFPEIAAGEGLIMNKYAPPSLLSPAHFIVRNPVSHILRSMVADPMDGGISIFLGRARSTAATASDVPQCQTLSRSRSSNEDEDDREGQTDFVHGYGWLEPSVGQ